MQKASPNLSKHRIEALSDGMFAIVMTILVLELSVSNLMGSMTLAQSLQEIWIDIMGYIVSFLVLGIYWILHHYQFHYIKRSDGVMLWINIMFLMTIALVPFSNKLLVYLDQTSIIFYVGNSEMSLFFLYILWWYVTRNSRLVKSNIKKRTISILKRTILSGMILLITVIIISFFSVIRSINTLTFLCVSYILLTASISDHLESKREINKKRVVTILVILSILGLIIFGYQQL